MRRREFLGFVGAAWAWPHVVRAQERPVLVGLLSSGSAHAYDSFIAAFGRGLDVLGYVIGKNVLIESRWADGRSANLRVLAEKCREYERR